MNARTTLTTLAVAASLVSASLANAASNNPLDPSHFSGGAAAVVVDAMIAPYAAAHNPLHPAYGQDRAWQATGSNVETSPYRDAHNPLHPQFKGS
jgi:hypothetical protein